MEDHHAKPRKLLKQITKLHDEIERLKDELEQHRGNGKPPEDAAKNIPAASAESSELLGGELYRLLMRLSADPVLITDLEGSILEASQKALKVFCFRHTPPTGTDLNILDLITKQDQPKTLKFFEHVLQAEKVKNLEVSFIIEDGTSFTGRLRTSVIPDHLGKPAGFMLIIRDITEVRWSVYKKRTLLESAEWLKIIYELAPDAYFVTDAEGTVIDCNSAVEEIFGYKKEELTGASLMESDLISHCQHERLKQVYERTVEGERPLPEEYQIKRRDGQTFTTEIRMYPVKIKGETLVLCIAGDVSDRHYFVSELKNSISLLRSTIESSENGVLVLDTQKRIVTYNKRFTDILSLPSGWTHATSPVQRALLLKHIARDPLDLIRHDRFLNDTPEMSGSDIIALKNGKTIERHYTPYYAGDRIAGRIWSLRDITDRRREAEKLMLSEEKFRALFESNPLMALTTDLDGIIMECNTQFLENLEYRRQEVIGHAIYDILSKEAVEVIRDTVEQCLKAPGKTISHELGHRKKDGGTLWVRCFTRAIRGPEDRRILLFVCENITAYKVTGDALRRRDKILKAVSYSTESFIRNRLWKENINGVLKQLGEAAEVNRVYIFEIKDYTSNGILCKQIHEWVDDNTDPQIDNSELLNLNLAQSGFSRWEEMLQRDEVIHGNIEDFPESERRLLGSQNIVSILVAPIFSGETLWGFIGYDDCSAPRHWSWTEIEALKTASDALGVEIQRTAYEAELIESERRYKTLLEGVEEGVMLMDKNLRVTGINKRGEEILRRESSQLIGLSPREIPWTVVDESGAPMAREKYPSIRTLNDKQPITGAVVGMKSEDGSILWLSMNTTPMQLEGGTGNPAVLITFSDITQRKLADSEFKKMEQEIYRLSAMAKQISSGVMITNTEGKMIWINESFTRMTGYHFDEVVGRKPADLLQGANTDKKKISFMRQKMNMLQHFKVQIYNYKRNGEGFWNELSVDPMFDSDGRHTGFIGVSNDVTEAVKQKMLLQSVNEQVEKSDKLKTEFLHQISHEIRTPINALLSVADILKYEGENLTEEEKKSHIDILQMESKRIYRTVDLILNLSEVESHTYLYSPTRIDLLEDVLKVLYTKFEPAAARKGLQMLIETEQTDTFIYADEFTVQQIFAHLVENAIKFTEKGFIKIVLASPRKNEISCTVKDTGIGISESFMKNLFEPFAQEESGDDKGYEGNGLGLALVKRYAELNKARISIDSEKHEGTTVSVVFSTAPKGT